jgi:hypothetical protein
LAVAVALACPVRASERDELEATPGLWKVTYHTQADPMIVKWRCISDEQIDDPWSAFAQLSPNKSCKRTSYTQTSKNISWKYTCTDATETVNSQGSITFDTRLHYSGVVKVDGVVMGYPIANTVAVEGVHRAACTSPDD